MKTISRSVALSLAACLCMAVLAWFALPEPALAQTQAPASNFTGIDYITAGNQLDDNSQIQQMCPGDGFIFRIVNCLRGTIISATSLFLYGDAGNNGFYSWIRPGVLAAVILAVVTFGYQIMFGMLQKPGPDMAKMMLKVVVVLGLVNTLPYWLGAVTGFMEDILAVITANMGVMSTQVMDGCPYAVDSSGGLLMVNDARNAQTADDMWRRWDCVLHFVVGTSDPIANNPSLVGRIGLASGITGFLVATLFSGEAGFMIFMVGVIAIVTLIFSVLRAVHIYITAYIGLAMMMAVGPIFIPCLLFRPTMPYFDKWVKNLVGFAVQPMFLFGFLALMFAGMQSMIWTSDTSLYRSITGFNYNNSPHPYYSPQYNTLSSYPTLGEYLQREGLLTYRAKLGWLFNLGEAELDNPVVNPVDDTSTPVDESVTNLDQQVGTGNLGNIPTRGIRGWLQQQWDNGNRLREGLVDKVRNPDTGDFYTPGQIGEIIQNGTVGRLKDFLGDALENAFNHIAFDLPFPVIDWDELRERRQDNGLGTSLRAVVTDILFALMTIAMGSYIMYTMLKYVPDMGHEIIGGFDSVNIAHVSSMPGEMMVGGAIRNASGAMHSHMSGTRGLLTGGGLEGVRGMLSGVRAAPGSVIGGIK